MYTSGTFWANSGSGRAPTWPGGLRVRVLAEATQPEISSLRSDNVGAASFAQLSGCIVLEHPGSNLRPRVKPELA
jgi:hypothetical protein